MFWNYWSVKMGGGALKKLRFISGLLDLQCDADQSIHSTETAASLKMLVLNWQQEVLLKNKQMLALTAHNLVVSLRRSWKAKTQGNKCFKPIFKPLEVMKSMMSKKMPVPLVCESTSDSARWCDSSETAVQAGDGGSAAPFLLLGKQTPQAYLARSTSSPKGVPPGAGRAHTACGLCTGRDWKASSFASDALQYVAPRSSRLCSAGGFAHSACICPSQWP